MKGRKAKATHLRVLEGNPGKRKLNRDEPKPRPIARACPSWLEPEAKAEWKRMLPIVERMGVMTEADGAAFAGYCQAWGEMRFLSGRIADLTKSQPSIDKELMDEIASAMRLRDKASLRMKAFASEFGFTPSSRTRLTVKRQPDEEEERRALLS